MPLTPITNPRKSTSFLKNLHFSSIVLNPALPSRSSISPTSLAYCSRIPLVNISTSSI